MEHWTNPRGSMPYGCGIAIFCALLIILGALFIFVAPVLYRN